jgi:chromosome segregation ATPase
MSKVREIREAIDTKLDAWEKQVSALEAQLTQSKEQALERLETQKKHFKDALNRFSTEVEKIQDLPKETKIKIRNQIEHLHVQLALGKMETREAYESQKKEIKEAITTFEASIDQQLDETFDALTQDLINEANAIEAELDALQIRFEMEKTEHKAQIDQKKQEFVSKIQAFKENIEARKQMTKDKAETFESELTSGLSQIKQAFSDLFS